MSSFNFFNLPNPSGHIRLWGYSASNRNEYQKQKKVFLENKERPVREADGLTLIYVPMV
jgi:hypothetical protein